MLKSSPSQQKRECSFQVDMALIGNSYSTLDGEPGFLLYVVLLLKSGKLDKI